MATLFVNCRIVNGRRGVTVSSAPTDWVLCRGGRVVAVGTDGTPPPPGVSSTVDCDGRYLTPGFIDLQFNGGWSRDFSDPRTTDLPGDIAFVRRQLLSTGVTSFLPTLISSSQGHYKRAIGVFKALLEAERTAAAAAAAAAGDAPPPGARVIGLHLEGPYMCPEKRGAHPPENLRVPGEGRPEKQEESGGGELASLLHAYGGDIASEVAASTGLLRLVTLAPELAGGMELSRQLAAAGVVVAVGHTAAATGVLETALSPAAATEGGSGGGGGATMLTHLYSAMPGFNHRDPGVLGLLLEAGRRAASSSNRGSGGEAAPALATPPAEAAAAAPAASVDDAPEAAPVGPLTPVPFTPTPSSPPSSTASPLYYSVIADGCHVHPRALAIAHSLHPAGLVLVTDAMRALGCPPGSYSYGDISITCHAGGGDGPYPKPHVVVAGTATLAGAVAPLDACLRNLVEALGCSVADAVAAATSVPASVLGLDGVLGVIAPGAWADFALLCPSSLVPQGTFLAGKAAWP